MRSFATFLNTLAGTWCAATGAALSAQTQVFSPPEAATEDLNSENTIPFRYVDGRYAQMHGDLLGPGRTFTALAMRRDGWLGPQPGATARTMDVELFCFHAAAGRPSTTFTANYATAPAQVIQRKMINLPDLTANLGNPAPWNIAFRFDVPFPYNGTQPFGWELKIRGSTATGAYFVDSYESGSAYGRVVTTGTGCIATGRSARMAVNPLTRSDQAANAIQLMWSISDAPANAPSSFLLATGTLDLPVPGLCTNLYVNGLFMTVNVTANAAGTVIMPTISVGYAPAFVGAQLHTQGMSIDQGQSGIPYALSNGAQVTVVPIPVLYPIHRLYTSGVNTAIGITDPTPYGLAVQLTAQ